MGLQLSIAVCVGMVAATFSPSVRRSIPRWFEIALWVALIFVCWLGIATIKDPQTRELTASINWAVGQIVNNVAGLAGAGVVSAVSTARFGLAQMVVDIFGLALLSLALISSHRQGLGWQPQIRLGEWMELPAASAQTRVAAFAEPSAVDDLNERLAAATSVAGAAAATWSVQFLIWARDVGLPRAEERMALAVAVGRVETKVLLESVRETARELEGAARTRYAGSVPEVNKLALRVAATLNGVTDSEKSITPGAGRLAQVIDIQALRIAQTLGRIGRGTSSDAKEHEKEDENGPEHPDRLAS
ncbi:MAG TPA: hypothetical protein VFD88_06795 [Clostridia bacterium]|nr:hypothetical protein [Clostridia bacterium]